MGTANSETTEVLADGFSASLSDITLRPLTLDDVDDFMVWAGDGRVAHFCRWEAFQSKEEAANYIADEVLPHPWFRAICLHGTPIGMISVSENTGISRCRGMMSYAVASRYWGKGIATAAIKVAAAEVFHERPELERLEAVVDVANPASQRVLEKVGFTREGVLRNYDKLKGRTLDSVMFSLLFTDKLLP